MNELVQRLQQPQPVSLSRLKDGISSLNEQIEMGYIHILFSNTGTELTIKVDKHLTKLPEASDDKFTLVGRVILNYEKIKVSAHVRISDFLGQGWVEPVSDDAYKQLTERD